MRIGFDCAKLVKGTSKSIGIYNTAKSVVVRLAAQLPKEHQLVVIGNEDNRQDFDVEGVEFHPVNLDINSTKAILLWETVRVNSYIRRLKLDEIVFPRGFTSFFCPVRDVVIIHDLIPFYYDKHYPGVLGRMQNAYVMLRMKSSIRTADKIITISEYSKKEILDIVPSADKKISVILHGFESHNIECNEPTDMPENYFFGITSKLPHKNAAGLLRAYAEYFAITPSPYDLVLAGISDLSQVTFEPEYSIPEEVRAHIHCNRFMDDARFYSLFRHSRGLVFLSVIEGFGLPPLEAMELGVPVICSDRTSLPEVVRDAGIMVDPEKPADVAEAMKRLTLEPELAEELKKKGYDNLKNFSWEERIKEYVRVLT